MAGWPSGQNSVPWLVLLTVASVLSKKPAFSGLFFPCICTLKSSAVLAAEYDMILWIAQCRLLPTRGSEPLTHLCCRVTLAKLSIIELPVSLLWLTSQFVLCLESMGGNLPCLFLWRCQLLINCFSAKEVSRHGRKRVGLWSNTETPFSQRVCLLHLFDAECIRYGK